MAIYHCKNSLLIDHVRVLSPRMGITQATITVTEKAELPKLQELRELLAKHGCSTLMDVKNGRSVIEVRGVKDPETLQKILKESGHAPNGIQIESTPDDDVTHSFGEKIAGKSLFLSALFYDLGNIAFIVSGIQRGRHNPGGRFTPNDYSEIMTGAAFSVGDVLMTLYGKDKGDEELAAAAEGLSQHLEKKGIHLPKENALTPETLHKSGFMQETNDWLRRNVVYSKCLSELAGGLFTIHAAMKPGNMNHGKFIAGLLISTGWASTLLLDKPRGHEVFGGDKPSPSTIAAKLADNPRGLIARPLAMGNNLANLWGAFNGKDGERTRFRKDVLKAERDFDVSANPANQMALTMATAKQHDYVWNVISACSFLVAHGLFGISGGKRPPETEDDKRMMDDLILLSANMLAKQPEAVREAAFEQTADYVAHLSHVTLSQDKLEQAMRDKLGELAKSDWAVRSTQQANEPAGVQTRG